MLCVGTRSGSSEIKKLTATDFSPTFAITPKYMTEQAKFTGDDWEQEDDVTLVTVRRVK